MPRIKCNCSCCHEDFYYNRDDVPDIRLSLQLKVLTNPGGYNSKKYDVLSEESPIHLCKICVEGLEACDNPNSKIKKKFRAMLKDIIKLMPGKEPKEPLNRFDVMDIDSGKS
tara:strand:- start:2234 stop:2569 length:336 start_codon:yes stop_codon:yes gene_type:complete